MIENIPLSVDAGYGTVIVAAMVIDPVVYEISPVFKGSVRTVRGRVSKSRAGSRRIDQIVGSVDLTG